MIPTLPLLATMKRLVSTLKFPAPPRLMLRFCPDAGLNETPDPESKDISVSAIETLVELISSGASLAMLIVLVALVKLRAPLPAKEDHL